MVGERVVTDKQGSLASCWFQAQTGFFESRRWEVGPNPMGAEEHLHS